MSDTEKLLQEMKNLNKTMVDISIRLLEIAAELRSR